MPTESRRPATSAAIRIVVGPMLAAVTLCTLVAPTPTASAERLRVRLVAMGDSVTSGYACACAGFPAMLARQITDLGTPADARVLGFNGGTALDAVAASRRPADRAALRDADVVVLTIGANDVEYLVSQVSPAGPSPAWRSTVAAALRRMSSSLDALLTEISTSPRIPRIVITGYWAVGLDGAVGRRRYDPAQRRAQVQLTDQVDAVLAAAAVRHQDSYLDLRPIFHGRAGKTDPTAMLAPDGDHPDSAGHAAIAAALLRWWLGSPPA